MKHRSFNLFLLVVIFTVGFCVIGFVEDQNAINSTRAENQQVAMEESIVTKVFLPIALAVIMFGMGLSLTTDDFKRVMVYSKATVLGLLNQLVLLPNRRFCLCEDFSVEP